MSDYDRGPYGPSADPPLAFDPRRPVRGAGPVPATLIISVLILAGLIGGVAFIYRGGIRHGTAPGQVGAPLGDIRAPAPAEAPDNSATAGLTIYKTGAPPAGNEAAPTFAAAPEQPQPRPGEAGAPLAVASAPPVVVAAGPPPPPPPPTAHAAKPAAQPSAIASLADAAANKPAAKAITAKPAAKPTGQAAATTAAPPAGAGWVQIGAFSSTALAEKGWSDIARLAPAAMAGKGKKVEPVDKGGSTVYRTYITGFASKAAATSFCDKLKAAGKSCLVK